MLLLLVAEVFVGTKMVPWAPSSAAPSFFRRDAPIACIALQLTSVQHWCSGFEAALSSVLNANREAEASSSIQLQTEIQSRDRAIDDMSLQLDKLRATNTDLISQLAIAGESREHVSTVAQEQVQRAQHVAAEAEARLAALEAKMEEQTKRHDEYAGFIAEVRMFTNKQPVSI